MQKPSVPLAQEQTAMDKQRVLPHVLAVTSGKGGVGKSSIAVNLGISLAKAGARVCILDADTGLANVNILLGLAPQFSLEHVLFGAKTIEEIMLEGPYGVKVIPGANGISECVSLHPRQQLRLTRELARIEGDFDYLLLDTAAGIADTTLDFVSSAHQTLVVITPEPTSLTDAFSLVKLMHRRRPTMRYQVVVNMCSSTAQAREVYHRFSAAVEKYIGIQTHYIGFLLRDESLRVAVSLQSPVALFPDTDPSSRSFIRLADALQQQLENSHPSLGFSGFWQRQYRQKQQQAATSEQPKPAVPERSEDQTERGYLAELKARLLLLMEREDAPRSELAGLLDDSHKAFVRRFAQPAFDPIAFVEGLVNATERDDQLLRQLAERLQPWQQNTLPAQITADAPPSVITTEPPFAVMPSSFQAVMAAADRPDIPPPRPALAAAAQHRYDERRFGSQQALLEMLRRQDESGKSALELIDILG